VGCFLFWALGVVRFPVAFSGCQFSAIRTLVSSLSPNPVIRSISGGERFNDRLNPCFHEPDSFYGM
jgi:hypothetical protein